jgi:nucleotide-binding universal stress UspA family protein
VSVLVGYVATPVGRAAFDAALDEAARRATRLVVVNSPHLGAHIDKLLVAEEEAADLTAAAAAAGVEMELRQTPHHDDVVAVLLDTAREVDAAVLVIGLRRRTPVGKLFLGSKAQQILLKAEVPVLAVKPAA